MTRRRRTNRVAGQRPTASKVVQNSRTAEDSHRSGGLSSLLSGKNLIVTAFITTLIGVSIPKIAQYVEGRLAVPLQATARIAPGIIEAYATPTNIDNATISKWTLSNVYSELQKNGAIAVEDQKVELVLRGNSAHVFTITDIQARILKKEPAISTTLFYSPFAEAVETPISLGIELAGPSLSSRDVTEDGKFLGAYFESHPYTLERDETAAFLIDAHATAGTYTWDIVLQASIDGINRTFYVDGDSGPFRVTSYSSSYQNVITDGGQINSAGQGFYGKVDDPVAFCGANLICKDSIR